MLSLSISGQNIPSSVIKGFFIGTSFLITVLNGPTDRGMLLMSSHWISLRFRLTLLPYGPILWRWVVVKNYTSLLTAALLRLLEGRPFQNQLSAHLSYPGRCHLLIPLATHLHDATASTSCLRQNRASGQMTSKLGLGSFCWNWRNKGPSVMCLISLSNKVESYVCLRRC